MGIHANKDLLLAYLDYQSEDNEFLIQVNMLKIIDSDIVQLLSDISRREELRSHPDYEFIKMEGAAEFVMQIEKQIRELSDSIKERIIGAAEIFYHVVKNQQSDLPIMQLRVGNFDEIPSVIMVIKETSRDQLKAIRQIARLIELHYWEQLRFPVNIWTITDKSLAPQQLEIDFPLSRASV